MAATRTMARHFGVLPLGLLLALLGGPAATALAQPKLLDTMRPGHTSWVRTVAFSPDGKLLASGSLDKSISMWDVKTGKSTASLTGHTDAVNSVAFSPDGKLLASGSQDDSTKLWDLAAGKR